MDVPRWSGRDLEVISGLRQLGDATKPDAAARQRMRGAILGRLRHDDRPSRRRRILAEVLAAAVALVIALSGLGLVLSDRALPGDALYGVKRAGESAELGLAFGDSAKAQKHLEFASNRLDELAALGPSALVAYESTLADFQREAAAGTAELTRLATQGSGDELVQLRSWSLAQQAKLLAARPAVPSAALGRFTSSAELLNRIEARAQTLMARLDCFRITTTETDELGAIPESGSCMPPADTTPAGRPPVPRPVPPSREQLPARQNPTSATPVRPSSASVIPPPPSTQAPPAIDGPVIAPTSQRQPTTTTSPPPPLISVPPLLPGLPGVGIG
ncbi:DUF5667 domain-containing protein [Amycolatopsis pithecellobii]|uniref:DUF5667 domain-containing protein n=1 Tax=Amycolatopsis pithecellobii TaxID=664692 RepID=A0A6N7Z710_9PSEU|nr:DUF5667 domain-containing protein [Amycolatopsis pithecellobii]MTD56720.1 hypothetical protein [Amycolatopsis pithecellobii]